MFIYSLYSSQDPNKVYIGSTSIKYLSIRKAQHRYYYKRSIETGRKIISSFDIVDSCVNSEDLCIEELEVSEESDKNREDWWIEHLKENGLDVVNHNRAVYSYEVQKGKLRKRYKQQKEEGKIPSALNYYYNNKERILAKRKEDYKKSKIKNAYP